MVAHPEDLVGLIEDVRTYREGLVEVRQVFREAPWLLTTQEEQDLIDDCRDGDELCCCIYVYDLMPVEGQRN